jgi:ABC-type glycerol-3-phosphate transport system permease component
VAYVFVHRECSITLYPRQLYRHLDCPPGSDRNVWEAFINTFTVTIPSTIIPIAVALFAAYAFSWMNFPGRLVLFAVVVGLLVVPLQMSLIPLLRLYANNATFLNENLIQVLNTGILADSGFQLAELRPKSYLGILVGTYRLRLAPRHLSAA